MNARLLFRIIGWFLLSVLTIRAQDASDKKNELLIRDSIIINHLCDSLYSDLIRFDKNRDPELEKQIVKTTFMLWLLYESDYKLQNDDEALKKLMTDNAAAFKTNFRKLPIQLPEDPLGWQSLLSDGDTIKNAVAGSSMFPSKFSSGGLEVYKQAMGSFREWWTK